MRCTEQVKIFYKDPVTFTEFDDNGNLKTWIVERWTHTMQQCPTTTKIKSARCWKRWNICGYHAAQRFPELYPKSNGSSTGGRLGKSKQQESNNKQTKPLTHPLIIPSLLT